MRDTLYLIGFLAVAALLLFVGRHELPSGQLLTWTVSFGATTAVAVLMVSLYRVRSELQTSRRELARKEAEIHFAREVQRSLFPAEFPVGDGLEFSATCIRAQGISGDYYDIFKLADGRVVFAIADVSGKGISAAIIMANLHALLRVVVHSTDSLEDICCRLNAHLHEVTEPAKFATLFLSDWDPGSGRIRYVNAGHQTPILLGSSYGVELREGGPPIGLFPKYRYGTGSVLMQPGDTMVLFSDGITEAHSEQEEEFGEERLREVIREVQDFAPVAIESAILRAVRDWAGNTPGDDMTIVTVRALQDEASSIGEVGKGSGESS